MRETIAVVELRERSRRDTALPAECSKGEAQPLEVRLLVSSFASPCVHFADYRTAVSHARDAVFVVARPVRIHAAIAWGSKRTQVPIRNEGILPLFACLKMVMRETASIWASSSAVRAWPSASILSASDVDTEGTPSGLVWDTGVFNPLDDRCSCKSGLHVSLGRRLWGQSDPSEVREEAQQTQNTTETLQTQWFSRRRFHLPSHASAYLALVSGISSCFGCRSDRARVEQCAGRRSRATASRMWL